MLIQVIFLLINLSYAQSGICGETSMACSWQFDYTTNNLAITGNGKMLNYGNLQPEWSEYSKQILTVTIEGVTSIGDQAFSSCVSIKNISIPNSVTSLGNYAFSGCESLVTVEIPIDNKLSILSKEPFNFGKVILSLTGNGQMNNFNRSDVTVSPWFTLLYNFKTVIIQEGITSVGSYSFYNMTNLQTLFIPGTVTSINLNALDCTPSLKNLVYSGLNAPTCANNYLNSQFNVIVQNSYNSYLFCSKKIKNGFEGKCGNNCYWKVDSSITRMKINGSGVMNDFNNQQPWEVFKNVFKTVTVEGVSSIGYRAFSYCTSLESITIQNSVTSIGSKAFYNCFLLEPITIPNSITNVGLNSFSYCTSLSSIIIPKSVTSIGDGAFSYCTSLQNITLQNSLTSIGGSTFLRCTSLQNITLPDSVTSIGDWSFYGCTSLKSIRGCIHYFGKGSLYGSGIESIIIGNGNEEGLSVYIGESAFHNCKDLKKVTIKPRFKSNRNDTYTKSCSVQINAFSNCPNIESFFIDGYVDEVNEYAFTFNANKEFNFAYNSSSPPQNCSNLDPKNNTMILPIFSANTTLIKVPKEYRSTFFCPCDKYKCPTEYVQNEDYDKIQNASVPIEKTLNELPDENNFSESSSESSENESSGPNEGNFNENSSSESISSEGKSSGNKDDDQTKSSSNKSSGDNENSSNEESSDDENNAIINTFTMSLFLIIIII